MEVRLLGVVEATLDGRPLTLGGAKQRAVLAMLALDANATVSADRLIDGLWGERGPPSPVKTVQVYVSRLRKLLDGGDATIVTRGRGYELRVAADAVDALRFERLVGRAIAEPHAHALAREALALWRGSPLSDLAGEPFAAAEIRRLEDLWLQARELAVEEALAAGEHDAVLGELEDLVASHPLRERPHAQRMLALYRCGRQADALRAYRDAREALVEAVGIEPGAELRRLPEAILQQDHGLDLAGPAPRRAAAPATATGAEEPHPSGAFVGREREVGELRAALDAALSARGRLVLIGGEPGIGKTRLADELAARASERGARVAWGRCWEAGGAPAYWPWVQSLRSYVREADPETIRADLGPGAPYVARVLPELRELVPGLPPAPQLDPEAARFSLFDATATFLLAVSRRTPLLIVLDDLHAADQPSLLLLEFLAQQLGHERILVLGTYRDTDLGSEHPLSAALTELTRGGALQLTLTGLRETDVERFIATRETGRPPARLAAAIHRETDGNPLFVGEILRLLTQEGAPAEPDASLRIAIPPGIRAVIARRLGHLPQECTSVLTLASVLGREFALDALARVSAVELDRLVDLLDAALHAGVVGDVPGARGRLRFSHALVRDALYEELTAARRMLLHRRVAEALEGLYAGDPEPHLAELAHHFCEAVPAGDAATAVDHARRAGDRATTLLAYEEAARLYALGLDIVASAGGGDAERCELLLRLGDVQARAGDIAASRAAFLDAAEVATAARLPELRARAALGYGGRFVWARAWGDVNLVPLLEGALAALPERDSDLRVRLLSRLAGGPLRDTLPAESRVAMSERAVDMARRLGDPATLAYALSGRHCADWGPDALDDRRAIADELVEVAERAGEPERAYEGCDFRLWAMLEAGEVAAAAGEREAKRRLASALRQPAQLWDVAVDRAGSALFEGRLSVAEAAIHEALDVGRTVQSANAQMAFDLQMYALRREQGRLAEVVATVERAAAEQPAYPVWRYVLADVLAGLGRDEAARAAFDGLAAEGFPVQVEMQWLFSMSLLPEVCRRLGDVERAQVLYERLAPYERRNAVTPPELCRGSVARGLGILAGTASAWDRATRHFETALAMDAEMGARPWLAYGRHDYARMLLARGDRERADPLLDSAAALAEELGMTALSAKIAAPAA